MLHLADYGQVKQVSVTTLLQFRHLVIKPRKPTSETPLTSRGWKQQVFQKPYKTGLEHLQGVNYGGFVCLVWRAKGLTSSRLQKGTKIWFLFSLARKLLLLSCRQYLYTTLDMTESRCGKSRTGRVTTETAFVLPTSSEVQFKYLTHSEF